MKIQKITLSAILIAMCFIGANIKLMGSVAFDAAPAFIGTLLLGPIFGMALGFLGHMVSALFAGFPLSFPIHLIIAVMMSLTMFFYGYTRKLLDEKATHKMAVSISILTAFVVNGPLSALALYPILKGVVIAMFPILAIASICNIAVAELVFASIPANWKSKLLISMDVKKS